MTVAKRINRLFSPRLHKRTMPTRRIALKAVPTTLPRLPERITIIIRLHSCLAIPLIINLIRIPYPQRRPLRRPRRTALPEVCERIILNHLGGAIRGSGTGSVRLDV